MVSALHSGESNKSAETAAARCGKSPFVLTGTTHQIEAGPEATSRIQEVLIMAKPGDTIQLDANCAHCHNPAGAAASAGINLLASESDPVRLGVRKYPVAAGRGSGGLLYDVLPGRPDESILVRAWRPIPELRAARSGLRFASVGRALRRAPPITGRDSENVLPFALWLPASSTSSRSLTPMVGPPKPICGRLPAKAM
ncbi:MAG: hypothetical protein ACC645_08090 [Pirellulales bacterium]